ncbi:hypothetical protein J7T55_008874 [Diaporthe amygdali]|uniref:uncharacterized protein n=1 Tax=Phomopsis amygdali TaxID=1214568 RepID=UPI0022FDD0D4|nr:uncharacterized protein J7T55_008874 [Diaporthe amygdali]KAJ0121707.1 hypothetical protein J7T55_008874 [Diaporthe amygdali]
MWKRHVAERSSLVSLTTLSTSEQSDNGRADWRPLAGICGKGNGMADESSKELVNRAERASREVAGFQEPAARCAVGGPSTRTLHRCAAVVVSRTTPAATQICSLSVCTVVAPALAPACLSIIYPSAVLELLNMAPVPCQAHVPPPFALFCPKETEEPHAMATLGDYDSIQTNPTESSGTAPAERARRQ